MSPRSYDQFCTIACALDVLGERWTLLVVRELMLGPRRFVDLLDGLPGIGPNLLTARLRALESEGLLRRGTLPPPAGSAVYQLTEAGRALEPVLVELGRWGARVLPGAAGRIPPRRIALAIRMTVRPEQPDAKDATYQLHVEDAAILLRVRDGIFEVTEAIDPRPDVVVRTDAETILAVGFGEIVIPDPPGNDRLSVSGDAALVRQLDRLLSVPVPAATHADPP